ncbi:hypothetical protein VTI28DRAFT_6416 [Corynascus sepedonium]
MLLAVRVTQTSCYLAELPTLNRAAWIAGAFHVASRSGIGFASERGHAKPELALDALTSAAQARDEGGVRKVLEFRSNLAALARTLAHTVRSACCSEQFRLLETGANSTPRIRSGTTARVAVCIHGAPQSLCFTERRRVEFFDCIHQSCRLMMHQQQLVACVPNKHVTVAFSSSNSQCMLFADFVGSQNTEEGGEGRSPGSPRSTSLPRHGDRPEPFPVH